MSVYIAMKKQLIDAYGEAGKWAAYEVYGMNSRGGTRAGENRLEEDFSMALELFARVPSLASKPQPYVRKAVRNAVLQGRKADSGGRVVVRDGHQIEAMTGVDMEGNKLEVGETPNLGDAGRILDLLWRAFEKTMEAVVARLDGTQTDAIYMQQAIDAWFNWAAQRFGRDADILRRSYEDGEHGRLWAAEEHGLTKREVRTIVEPGSPIHDAFYRALLPVMEARKAAKDAA
jgi:hypothetical protein